MAKGRASIRDVARESGVSLTTVSLVLNNNDRRISEPTRNRVLAAMEKLAYTPSRLARGLPTRRSKTLAILVPALHHAFADVYFGEIISGIYESAADRGYRILLEVARQEFVRRKQYLTLLDDCSVDGILFVGATEAHEWLADFDGADKPLVIVNNYFDHWAIHQVLCDYEAAGRLAADHIADLGHRAIGHICGPSSQVATIKDLTESFTSRLTERGLRLDSSMIVEGELKAEHGRLACAELLQRNPDLTAIFAANDKMALGAYQALRDAGRKPGEDVTVVGCDDIPSAALADPPLTTVRMNFVEVGAAASELLIDRLERNEEGAEPILERRPVDLVERGSSCPAGDAAAR